MKYVLSTVFVLIAAVAGFGQPTKYKDTSEVPRITLEDAKKAYDDKTAVVVDARPIEAYKEQHVKGAINIPLGSTSDFSSLPKGKTIIVYCS
ncbi:MAG: rhodanese-like domain-containing protein [Pyrinomonadaceae bacterium]